MTFSATATTVTISRLLCLINSFLKKVTLRTYRNSSRQINQSPHSCLLHKNAASKRSFLYTSLLSKGSLTIEAAIAIPLFFLGLLSFIYIANIIYLQLTLQIALEETMREISKEAYISTEFYSMSTDEQKNTTKKDSTIIENLGATFISTSYIKDKFLTDDILELLDNSNVNGGSNGLSFAFSSIDLTDDTLDIIINYKCSVPFIPSNLLSFNLSNRYYTRIYIGQDMDKKQEETYLYIYFTSSGTVVHTNKYCQYLLNYTRAVRYRDIIKEQSLNNCVLCSRHSTIENLYKTNPVVYLTSTEDTYHITLDCQTFTKNVFRRKVSNLDNENVCKKCMEGK